MFFIGGFGRVFFLFTLRDLPLSSTSQSCVCMDLSVMFSKRARIPPPSLPHPRQSRNPRKGSSFPLLHSLPLSHTHTKSPPRTRYTSPLAEHFTLFLSPFLFFSFLLFSFPLTVQHQPTYLTSPHFTRNSNKTRQDKTFPLGTYISSTKFHFNAYFHSHFLFLLLGTILAYFQPN